MNSTCPDRVRPSKRRLLLITVADLGQLSGPAIHVLNLARHLSRPECHVTLVSPEPGRAMPVALGPSIDHRLLPRRRARGLPAMALLPQLVACLRTLAPPDAVYLRASVGTWPIVTFARRRWGVPVIVEYNAWFGADLAAMGRANALVSAANWLQLREAHSADAIRVVTHGLRAMLVERGIAAGKIRVIDNGTDLTTFEPLDQAQCRQRLGLPAEGVILGFAGNLWPALDFKTVFAAMRHLADRGRASMLAVIGDGAGRAGFEGEARVMLGAAAPIRWLGARPPEAVNHLLNAADVVLAPFTVGRNSITGLAPLKIRDCAAAGRACVATRVAGIDELQAEPWMFLAEPESPTAFAAAIEQALATDPALLRVAARGYAEAHFDWRQVAHQVEALAFAQQARRSPVFG